MILGLTSDVYGPDRMYGRCVDGDGAEAVADPGGGTGGRGGRGAAVGAGGGEPQQAGELRDDDGSLQSMLRLENSNLARGQITNGDVSADIVMNGQISHARTTSR